MLHRLLSFRGLVVLVLVVIVAGAGLFLWRDDPELIGTDMEGQQAPPFTLIDHRGETVQLSDLQGKAVAMTFIFSNCPDVCPLIVNRMRLAYESLSSDVQENVALVAITVDPERDTPEVLNEYSQARGMGDIDNWYALTADRETLEPLWSEYYVGVGEPVPADPDVVAAMEEGEHDPQEFLDEHQSDQQGATDQEIEEPAGDARSPETADDDHDHGAEPGEGEEGTAYWLAHTDVIYFIDPDGFAQALLRGDYSDDDLAHNLKILAP